MAVDIAQLLAFAVKNNASDLHLSAGVPPMIRVDGDMKRVNMPALAHKEVHSLRNSTARALSRQRVQPEPRRRGGVPQYSLGHHES